MKNYKINFKKRKTVVKKIYISLLFITFVTRKKKKEKELKDTNRKKKFEYLKL